MQSVKTSAQELFVAVSDPYVRPERIRELVEAGADLNAGKGDGSTILMTAVKYVCNSDVIDELLKAGADVESVDEYGYNAFINEGGILES